MSRTSPSQNVCVYSGAPPFPNRNVYVSISYVKGYDAAATAAAAVAITPFYELCKRYITKTVCIGVNRDRFCNERILRTYAHEKHFVVKRYTPTCINPCLCGTWKERHRFCLRCLER